jgi:hypothetical protein
MINVVISRSSFKMKEIKERSIFRKMISDAL